MFQPSLDDCFITLLGTGQRLLKTPAQVIQDVAERVHMIGDTKFTFNHALNALQRPTLGGKTSGTGATLQQSPQGLPLGAAQFGRTSRGDSPSQRLANGPSFSVSRGSVAS